MTRASITNIGPDGREFASLVVRQDYTQVGEHHGAVIVEGGTTTVRGAVAGSLHVKPGLRAIIFGEVHGSVHVEEGASVVVRGAIKGSAHVEKGGTIIVEEGARHAGSLHNDGTYILRGAFGGSQDGRSPIVLEGNGCIKQPTIKDGANYYEW